MKKQYISGEEYYVVLHSLHRKKTSIIDYDNGQSFYAIKLLKEYKELIRIAVTINGLRMKESDYSVFKGVLTIALDDMDIITGDLIRIDYGVIENA